MVFNPGCGPAHHAATSHASQQAIELRQVVCDLRRQGALVAALGLPTVVVQEGGYAVETLGDNVLSWLGGLLRPVPAPSEV